ncbi:MAG: cytochrome c biogenesis protein CcsA, partial [Deltaproteobacteria bacterium]
LSHTIALAIRTYESDHAPMLAMYETLLFYGWSTVLLSVIVVFRYNERLTELITVPVAILAMVFAQLNETPPKPLTLILRTRWFETHVITSFAAYAFFTLAFAGAVLYLLYGFRAEGSGLKKDFQDIANRSVLWGFFFFSASMFAGAVWAYLAWGTYWLWEPKVIWSFIVWFYYAGAMHAYYVKEWRGNGLAVATVGGFFVVLFTYLGVSLLMKSSHSF